MYAELSAAITSTKAALEIAKAAHGLAKFNELVAAISEVNEKLIAAQGVALSSQEKLLSLSEQVATLKEELAKLKGRQVDAEDYKLQDVGGGFFAYVYKPAVPGSKPRHWACVKSFTEHGLGILQREQYCYKCALCGAEIVPYAAGSLVAIEEAYE
jgi:hypothetical protein